MLANMRREEDQEAAKGGKELKRAQKREEKAEQVAEESQRKVTRAAAAAKETDDAAPQTKTRGRGNTKKTGDKSAKISSYFTKAKRRGKGIERDRSGGYARSCSGRCSDDRRRYTRFEAGTATSTSDRGESCENTSSKAWSGSSPLYENGLNGILADEMGLGKTIQTISFLAFLREMETYGPFLIVAPLSTTTNWLDEFRKWTPTIPALLYHGTPKEREELRRTKLKRPESPQFPAVITSYEICMNDRKHLANLGWKFIIIVSQMRSPSSSSHSNSGIG